MLRNNDIFDSPPSLIGRGASFPSPLDGVPEKLSQHRHKKGGALSAAVVNLLIPLVSGGSHEARDLLIKNQQEPYLKRAR